MMSVTLSSRRWRIVLAALLLTLIVTGCARSTLSDAPAVVDAASGVVTAPNAAPGKPLAQFNGTVFENPTPAFPFEGVNYTGEPFRMSEQKGKVVVVFFGYTFCPDICPLALADLKAVATKLGEKAQDLAVVFVTIDPERDTIEKLAAYVKAFDPAFYGVRLEGKMYETTKAAYGVFVEKRAAENGDPNNYFVDHSAGIYVIDKNGNLTEAFRADAGVDALTPDLEFWLSQ